MYILYTLYIYIIINVVFTLIHRVYTGYVDMLYLIIFDIHIGTIIFSAAATLRMTCDVCNIIVIIIAICHAILSRFCSQFIDFCFPI